MNNDIDFKKIWNKQKIEIPELKDLYDKANRFKKRHLFKIMVANILLLMTSTSIALIWYYYKPELLTSKIGIILVILAMVIYLITYNTALPLLLKKSIEYSSKESLQQLIELKEKQLFQQTTMLSIYFIILSLGIGLYMYEYVSRMTIIEGSITYGLTLLWFAINWFYLRPKTIKKQQEKTNKLISRFRELDEQLIE